jgi:hypothetical protein
MKKIFLLLIWINKFIFTRLDSKVELILHFLTIFNHYLYQL